MPFGEMTVTLHDVDLILDIPIYDDVVYTKFSQGEIVQMLSSDFGRDVRSTSDASREIP